MPAGWLATVVRPLRLLDIRSVERPDYSKVQSNARGRVYAVTELMSGLAMPRR